MKCHGIRRLTAAERAARDEAYALRYDAVYAQAEAEEREEYEKQFGPTYRAKYPFKTDGVRLHEKVIARIKAEQAME